MKADLTKTTFIVHYRKDHQDREDNLRRVLDYLNTYVDFAELILINDDKSPETNLKQIIKDKGNIQCYYLENNDVTLKARCLNIAAQQSQSGVLCFYDCDVIIRPDILEQCQNRIISGEYHHLYPFSGLFVDVHKKYLQNPITIELIKQFERDLLQIPKNDRIPGASNNQLDICHHQSPGGCNMILKSAFDKVKYDDRFKGWGFEDTDYFNRYKRAFGNKSSHTEDETAICWHMNHDNAIRNDNPYFNYNMQIYNQNCLT